MLRRVAVLLRFAYTTGLYSRQPTRAHLLKQNENASPPRRVSLFSFFTQLLHGALNQSRVDLAGSKLGRLGILDGTRGSLRIRGGDTGVGCFQLSCGDVGGKHRGGWVGSSSCFLLHPHDATYSVYLGKSMLQCRFSSPSYCRSSPVMKPVLNFKKTRNNVVLPWFCFVRDILISDPDAPKSRHRFSHRGAPPALKRRQTPCWQRRYREPGRKQAGSSPAGSVRFFP